MTIQSITRPQLGLKVRPAAKQAALDIIRFIGRLFIPYQFIVVASNPPHSFSEKFKMRFTIDKIAGFTPFKRVKYLDAQDVSQNLAGRRVLFHYSASTMVAEYFFTGANSLLSNSNGGRSYRFCVTANEAPLTWQTIGNWQPFIDAGQLYVTPQNKAERKYFRMVREKFMYGID